jgi:hypothetical protein
MNAPVRLVVLSLSVLALSACASSHPVARAPAAEPLRPGEVRIERNHAYMAEIERAARRRGIDVQWVKPPYTRVAAVD